jgi:hypothetical protein
LGKPQYDSPAFRELFAKSCAINLMAATRILMFGLRDVWFVVGLPVFLYAEGWRYMQVAGFLAAWTIGYCLAQALAPNVIRRSPMAYRTRCRKHASGAPFSLPFL